MRVSPKQSPSGSTGRALLVAATPSVSIAVSASGLAGGRWSSPFLWPGLDSPYGAIWEPGRLVSSCTPGAANISRSRQDSANDVLRVSRELKKRAGCPPRT